ncbi:MAG: cytochrome c family protein [Alphaproteobacteria bacterium]
MRYLMEVCLRRQWGVLAFLVLLALSSVARAEREALDASLVVGPTACGKCHKAIAARWNTSHHAEGLYSLPQSKDARTIASKLGIKNFLTDARCAPCHVTINSDRAQAEPIAGVSCESCHGAGFRWNTFHGEYSGKKPETETEEERIRRWKRSEKDGMIRPLRVYEWAKNCFSCHVVANEDLVDQGGHTPGNENYELLAWSLGEVRHNITEPPGTENRMPDQARQRLVFVIGVVADLEHSLRAVALATRKSPYAAAMAKRVQTAREKMNAIDTALSLPETANVVKAIANVKLRLNNRDELVAAAELVSSAGTQIAQTYTGETFAPIDSLLPGAAAYRGK